MMFMIRRSALTLTILLWMLSSCGMQSNNTPASALLSGEQLAPIDPTAIKGTIDITGSSTVAPLTARIAEDFHAEGSTTQIDIKVTGTGGGLRSFCHGDTIDLVNASRPITEEEIAACRAVGREPLGFQVGVDGLAVVIHPDNTAVQSLSFAQLRQIFTGEVRRWNDLDPSYPAQPIAVYSPGVDSGTFDFFVEKVLGNNSTLLEQLSGAVLSEDDMELVRGIEGNPYAIGYFGYAYYQEEGGRLRTIPIDGGRGVVAVTEASVADGSYPLARPLFVYTSKKDLMQSTATAAFLSYYLQHVHEVVQDVGYFPTTPATQQEARQALITALR